MLLTCLGEGVGVEDVLPGWQINDPTVEAGRNNEFFRSWHPFLK